ncbi:MAG: class I SAM-dependent methyltransferase [Patescibacteria group bacterium]|nr:class I SAM-dependent methyltransferase [Patescibacteria group bacterium]
MKRLLDIGCGPGAVISIGYYKKFNGVQIYGIDNLKKNINRVKKRFPGGIFKYSKAEKLPFPDSFFDYILARHVLEHVDDVDKTLLEIQRVTKKGATLIIAVPHSRMENVLKKLDPHYLGKGHHHKRMFSQDSLVNLLKKYGFSIDKTSKEKWPLFLYTTSFMFISKHTKGVRMEEQTGTFKVGKFRYLQIRSIYPLLDAVFIALSTLNITFPFLNKFIPFEIEVIAKKK